MATKPPGSDDFYKEVVQPFAHMPESILKRTVFGRVVKSEEPNKESFLAKFFKYIFRFIAGKTTQEELIDLLLFLTLYK